MLLLSKCGSVLVNGLIKHRSSLSLVSVKPFPGTCWCIYSRWLQMSGIDLAGPVEWGGDALKCLWVRVSNLTVSPFPSQWEHVSFNDVWSAALISATATVWKIVTCIFFYFVLLTLCSHVNHLGFWIWCLALETQVYATGVIQSVSPYDISMRQKQTAKHFMTESTREKRQKTS